MNVVCLDGIAHIEIDDEVLGDSCLVLGRVADHLDELEHNEASIVSSSATPRKDEFSSGRRVAHVALQEFGIQDFAIAREERRPVWPETIVGSISHTKFLAAALVDHVSHFRGLGVDLEPITAVTEKVASRVLLNEEQQWVANIGRGEWRTAIYSAKESVYKAVNPIVGEYLGFRDVNIEFAVDALAFKARTITDRPSSDVVASGVGQIHRVEGHWLTFFLVK